jgi:3-methyladenine DNA glycosylase AlkD
MSASQIKKQLQQMADNAHATQLQRFFKTGPGEYGHGDRFLGIRVPKLRSVAKAHRKIDLSHVTTLLQTNVHEHRMVALLILTYRYPKAIEAERERIYDFYLENTRWINNWDLVDVTAPHIVGAWLLERNKEPLYTLVKSDSLWERRIAIIATFCFIRRDRFEHTLKLADRLLADTHDLIHKAVGWMLREVGKRDQQLLEDFLALRYAQMPRTMLRYAIERLPEPRRQDYLKGRI